MTLCIADLSTLNLSITVPKVSSIVPRSFTQNDRLALSRDVAVMAGSFMPKMRIILLLVLTVAVAVKAKITALRTRELSATCITGEIRNDKDLQVRVMNGEFHIVFIGPKLLLTNPLWRQMVRIPVHLVAFVVDEARCVTKW